MLRITTHETDDVLVMVLEGSLSGPWVLEARAAWRLASGRHAGRPIRVDMRGLCHVDRDGRTLMARMYLEGAEFLTAGCEMPEIVREISQPFRPLAVPARRS